MDQSELVFFASKVAKCLNCYSTTLAEIAGYCVQKRVYLSGKFTQYEIITDYNLTRFRTLCDMPLIDLLVQAKSGLLLINEKGVTTEAAKVVPEESYQNRFYFTEDEITDGVINVLGKQKVLKTWPRMFYYINQIL